VPTSVGTSQAWHWPAQAASQQTPSTQWPSAHWPSALQVVPGGSLGRHRPEAQKSPAGHWLSAVQPPVQRAPLQEPGAQGTVCSTGQSPEPAQEADRVATPLAQLAARQLVAAPG
jgi:hypothetical protein